MIGRYSKLDASARPIVTVWTWGINRVGVGDVDVSGGELATYKMSMAFAGI
jgi:hypothetical protein